MSSVGAKVAVLLGAAVLVSVWGCGGGGTPPPVSSSTEEAKVSGKVTIYGKPATKGAVTFDPSNIQRKNAAPHSSAIGKGGSYSVTTLVGTNAVTVTSPEAQKAGLGGYVSIEYDVKSGDNTFNIDLPLSGSSPPPGK